MSVTSDALMLNSEPRTACRATLGDGEFEAKCFTLRAPCFRFARRPYPTRSRLVRRQESCWNPDGLPQRILGRVSGSTTGEAGIDCVGYFHLLV